MGRGSDELLRDLLGLQERLLSLFEARPVRPGDREAGPPHWVPPVDIYETPDAFVLTAEVPGVDEEEIRLELAEDLLTLRGQRTLHTPRTELGYHRMERAGGSFQRAFRLPCAVDPDAVSATCRDGVLRVTLPKRGSGRSVSVRVEDPESTA